MGINKDDRVIMLGTTGGPNWWGDQAGISTAVVVDGKVYLVDCGTGLGHQFRAAGLDMQDLAGVFITHLHSDHIVDVGSLLAFGGFALTNNAHKPVPIYGPGPRGVPVPVSSRALRDPGILFEDEPAPGTKRFWEQLQRAYATDLNDRLRDSLGEPPNSLFSVQDVPIPASLGFHADENPSPLMEPILVHEDDTVRVTAVLVEHPPMAPAFAYRFDSASGSVVISGDTAPSQNLINLAKGAGLLLHEVIDPAWIHARYNHGQTQQEQSMIDHHLGSHTSVLDVGSIASAAGVSQLALHHFVPPTKPPAYWRDAVEKFDGQLFVGYDLMEIPLKNPSEGRRSLYRQSAWT